MSSPRPEPERHAWIDALRGFALLGIALYNAQVQSGVLFSAMVPGVVAGTRWGEAAGPGLTAALHVLVQGKFYSLFSFLFGLGIALQLERHGATWVRRRLAWLLAIGLAHAILVWFGDILTVYAVLGFALVALRGTSTRMLLVAGLACLMLPPLLYAVAWAAGVQVPSGPGAGGGVIPGTVGAAVAGDYPALVENQVVLYGLGWLRRLVQFALPRIFGMFLLGMWAARVVLPRLQVHCGSIRRLLLVAAAVGLPLNIADEELCGLDRAWPLSATGLAITTLAAVGIPLLAMGYAAAFALAWRRPRGLWVQAGRTALSHYLGQSLVAITLYYGFGFGLFGQVSTAAACIVAVATFLVLAFMGGAWLRVYPQGPVEMLWRRAAGARGVPMPLRSTG